MNKKGTVWVIGGSGGLGLATAAAFAKDGWLTISGARSFPNEPTGGDPVQLRLDVTDEESCKRFVQQALAISPCVDVLVCAAAVLVLGSCEQTGTDELERVMQTNFIGMTRMVRHALPLMRAAGSGRIILFSSINGLLGIPFQSAYTASKHAMEGYAECLAMECRDFGIQVSLVEPGDHRGGSQRTRLHAAMENDHSPYRKAYQSACAVIERDENGGLMPERLAQKVVQNANKRRMRFRLRVAKPDQRLAVLLHDVFPAWAHFAILRGYYATKGR